MPGAGTVHGDSIGGAFTQLGVGGTFWLKPSEAAAEESEPEEPLPHTEEEVFFENGDVDTCWDVDAGGHSRPPPGGRDDHRQRPVLLRLGRASRLQRIWFVGHPSANSLLGPDHLGLVESVCVRGGPASAQGLPFEQAYD